MERKTGIIEGVVYTHSQEFTMTLCFFKNAGVDGSKIRKRKMEGTNQFCKGKV